MHHALSRPLLAVSDNTINHIILIKIPTLGKHSFKLEDLKVLRRSPDLLNNVKIGQGHLQLILKQFFLPYMGVAAILVK